MSSKSANETGIKPTLMWLSQVDEYLLDAWRVVLNPATRLKLSSLISYVKD